MTTVTIIRDEKGQVVSYYAHGHTGYDEIGKDIVCASVSTATLQTGLGILEILKLPVLHKQNEEDGFLRIDLREIDIEAKISLDEYNLLIESKRENLNVLLETMVEMLKQLKAIYPKHLELIEKEDI